MNAESLQADMFSEEDRFWEQYVGARLISDPVTAIVELVANAWDAGARRVDVEWPARNGGLFRIADDGEGMTKDEFLKRWSTLSYDRTRYQDDTINVEVDGAVCRRRVFGRNGIGRFAAFCFGKEYNVITTKDGHKRAFHVKQGKQQPLDIDMVNEEEIPGNGTQIEVLNADCSIPANIIRVELGKRFLTDPSFAVFVNNTRIEFEDIEAKGLEIIKVPIPSLNIEIIVKVIDAQRPDRTVKQHGVAWHVLGRLVGDCDWQDPEQKSLIDGRRVEAKRFTFIVEADALQEYGAVLPDWSGFKEANAQFKLVNRAVQDVITKRLLGATSEKRQEITRNIQSAYAPQISQLTPLKRETWNKFVERIQEDCPSLSETELRNVAGVLASMEQAQSKYALLSKLKTFSPDQIDDLDGILEDWSVDMAKIVLDELQTRLKLVDELINRTLDDKTLEVQDLQPLFHQGLWIFGPEYETIEFTSNRGMTEVIKKIFGREDVRGSKNRPDFVVIPDGTVGLYSYPEYSQKDFSEVGVAKVIIVELKAPTVQVTDKEKEQAYKYIRELSMKGLISERTIIRAFVLGRFVNPVDNFERTELNGRATILPMNFDTVLRRARSRLFNLYDKILKAPFLQDKDMTGFLSVSDCVTVVDLAVAEVSRAS